MDCEHFQNQSNDTQSNENQLENSLFNFGKSSNVVSQKKNIYKKSAKIIDIDWKIYRIGGFIFFILSFFVMKYLVDHFKKQIDDVEMINILKIVAFFFILNFGTFLFITVYYKYRKTVKGVKGPRGDRGGKGRQGRSNYCNICEHKTGSFKKEIKKLPQKEIIDNSSVVYDFTPKTQWFAFIKQPVGGVTTPPNPAHTITFDVANAKSFMIMTPGYLGVAHPSDPLHIPASWLHTWERSEDDTDPNTYQYKPIIGASASYNEKTGELYSLMYFYDGNKSHNPNKYNYKPMKKMTDTTTKLFTHFGRSDKAGVGAEFKAPANSAVYKVEVLTNDKIIMAVRFYCANVMTGEPVLVLDPLTNKMRKYATIGKAVKKDDITTIVQSTRAGNFYHNAKYYQSFISNVGAYYDDDRIYSLGFFGASYYNVGGRRGGTSNTYTL